MTLFDNKEVWVSDLTAELADYRRTIEVIHRPDDGKKDNIEIEIDDKLEETLYKWKEIDEMVEKIVDPEEIVESIENDEEFYYIRQRPPLDQTERTWVVLEVVPAPDYVKREYSLASVIISKS